MKRETLYCIMGDIDDELIQEASEARGEKSKKPIFYRIASAAACLCLICSGIAFVMRRDAVYVNNIPAPHTSKLAVSSYEDTQLIPMTYEQLMDYYGIKQPPDVLGGLKKTPQSFFMLYRDAGGSILYDTNTLYYSDTDQAKALSVTLAKAKKLSDPSRKDARESRLSGIPVLLASHSVSDSYTVHWVEFTLKDVSFRMYFDGLSEDEFIGMTKEFIRLIKQ